MRYVTKCFSRLNKAGSLGSRSGYPAEAIIHMKLALSASTSPAMKDETIWTRRRGRIDS